MPDIARKAAFEALQRCGRNGSWSAQTADAVIKKYGLEGRDAALAVNIILGVMQNMTLCDFYIDSFLTAKSALEPQVRSILRMGVYQLLFMDRIPDNAAVNESVELCREVGAARAVGLVNAVLRKLAGGKNALPEIPDFGTAKYLSIRYSHPLWLCQYLIHEHGYAFAEAFLASDNEAPETCIQVNTLKTSAAELSQRLECKEHPWLPDCLTVKGNITKLYGFDEGFFYVQDPAAKCAVLASGIEPGMKVLDACAAPGGKSFSAAIKMKNTGSILSCDIHDKKTALIKSGAERLGISVIDVQTADARLKREGLFDLVIADVPCSGYGVIRKKPEIRFKDESERKALPDIQLAILRNLSANVKKGGELIYSTCTVFREENEDVINAFLSETDEFEPIDFKLPNGRASVEGMYTFYPNIDGTDGFFLCRLRRKN